VGLAEAKEKIVLDLETKKGFNEVGLPGRQAGKFEKGNCVRKRNGDIRS